MKITRDYNHQPNGKFGPGNDGGPGRPKREVERAYLDLTIGTVSPELWEGVVKAMLREALKGSVSAATWLANYVLGKPSEQINLSHEQVEEITLILPRLGANGNGKADGETDSEPYSFGSSPDNAVVDDTPALPFGDPASAFKNEKPDD